MKVSEYKSYKDLPLFLNAEIVSKVLGIAPSSAYELLHEKDFPSLRIGNRIVVPSGWMRTQEGTDEAAEQRKFFLSAQ